MGCIRAYLLGLIAKWGGLGQASVSELVMPIQLGPLPPIALVQELSSLRTAGFDLPESIMWWLQKRKSLVNSTWLITLLAQIWPQNSFRQVGVNFSAHFPFDLQKHNFMIWKKMFCLAEINLFWNKKCPYIEFSLSSYVACLCPLYPLKRSRWCELHVHERSIW